MANVNPKIVPHLWYDREAVEAAQFYASVFPESRVTKVTTLSGTPSGDCDQVSFEIWGQEFMAISGGPHFRFNPSVSFFVNFDPSRDKNAARKLDEVWDRLSEGGQALMPLGKYPFSERYGWIQDKYGLSWQLILTNPEGEERPAILPALTFVGEVCGRAEEAMSLYVSVFGNSRQGMLVRYPEGSGPDQAGTILFSDFRLENLWFTAMDSAHDHRFQFDGGVSFMVKCHTQEEIDHYWERLSAVPEAEQCGWLTDQFGVSWQIVPANIGELLEKGTPEQAARVTKAFMNMKKFDLAALQQAYRGE
ncbi:VOC family protein [Paenibacillus spiritus]|uniref:VOC family protein n=1 Tax=Paenibacillus spiritus TaxID=2496557 RepID=A0A5J5G5D7_9BACL|nr:VOC family protein [Paenibacillus spiritus]KAA9002389.1 VOC family protein [Paenibacillus spiritus]